jgi:hypothetical protein
VSDAFRAIVVAVLALAGVCGWVAWQTLRALPDSAERVVLELRLAQFGAAILVLTAGASIGLSAANEQLPGAGLETALAMGFFVVAVTAALREPREALTILALAFVGHALFDIMHRPGLLPEAIAPRWYLIGCAIYDIGIGALCYLPLVRRY